MQTGTAPRRRAVVALGANLGDRMATLERAVDLIGAEVGLMVARSGWIETAAMIHPDDPATSYPAFLNGVALARTDLDPAAVLARLHAIEARLGRDRSAEAARWRPRAVDLDLVALDDLVVALPGLRLPHPGMHERRFVLEPMAEVWPGWRHPVLGRTVAEMLAGVGEGEVKVGRPSGVPNGLQPTEVGCRYLRYGDVKLTEASRFPAKRSA